MFNLEVLIHIMFVRFTYLFRPKIKIGEKVIIFGGYEIPPHWLGGDKKKIATVIMYMPSQQKRKKALLVKFDEPFEIDNYTAKFAVLELRHVGAKWHDGEICHLEICNFEPENRAWQDRKHGVWIESHASIKVAK